MKEKKVKKIIGDENWEKFLEWMSGQTVGRNNDGSTDYFESDVKAFENLSTFLNNYSVALLNL